MLQTARVGLSGVGADAHRMLPRTESAPTSAERTVRLQHLSAVRRWCAVFGPVAVDDVEGFDLVVVGRATPASDLVMDTAQVHALRSKGILVLAHLAVGTQAVASEIVAAVAAVQESAWGVDVVAVADAHRLVSAVEAATAVVALGYDGVYVDDLDDAAERSHQLVRAVRGAMPSSLVLVQAQSQPHDMGADGIGQAQPLRAGTSSPAQAATVHGPAHQASLQNRRPRHLKTSGRWS